MSPLFGRRGGPDADPAQVQAQAQRDQESLERLAQGHIPLAAAERLATTGIEAEVVDPVSLVPLDRETLLGSVRKTGRLLVVDTSWVTCGVSAEIASISGAVPIVPRNGRHGTASRSPGKRTSNSWRIHQPWPSSS